MGSISHWVCIPEKLRSRDKVGADNLIRNMSLTSENDGVLSMYDFVKTRAWCLSFNP